jgi:hypothetical protein
VQNACPRPQRIPCGPENLTSVQEFLYGHNHQSTSDFNHQLFDRSTDHFLYNADHYEQKMATSVREDDRKSAS